MNPFWKTADWLVAVFITAILWVLYLWDEFSIRLWRRTGVTGGEYVAFGLTVIALGVACYVLMLSMLILDVFLKIQK